MKFEIVNDEMFVELTLRVPVNRLYPLEDGAVLFKPPAEIHVLVTPDEHNALGELTVVARKLSNREARKRR